MLNFATTGVAIGIVSTTLIGGALFMLWAFFQLLYWITPEIKRDFEEK